MAASKYFFKVHLVGRFEPLVSLWNPGLILNHLLRIIIYHLLKYILCRAKVAV